ncbi:MAG TPA: tetratricopeptide repeat protein, partial [Pyrinomonadaceae bacterium]|nr:tetratricopeptide repeat protein [Pyrinomonadaceae bacterium]
MTRKNSMSQQRVKVAASFAVLLCLLLSCAPRAWGQDSADYRQQRERAMQLYDQNKFTEAIPILEKLVKIKSDDTVLWERLGWATYVVAGSIKDPAERQQARARARAALLRAQELGDTSELLRTGLQGLSRPDPADLAFSSNKEADDAMRAGEEAHTRGDLDKAIASYQRALELDPKLYLAALYIGDMYFKKGYNARSGDARTKNELLDKAGEWFAKAIAIEENIETAHRYWGDALMLQGKQQEALVKFIDAIIADPGNRNGYMGLSQWGQQTQTGMRHPQIEVPVKLAMSGDRKLDVSFDPALRESPDGSGAWEQYGMVRAKWVAEDFAKAYP